MDRREFLRQSAVCLLGLMIGEWKLSEVEAAYTEPMIYKRFFDFTEYKDRKATEFIVIHHTGFPGVDKDSTAAAIHKYHQEHNGWAGIGYHYLIRKDGMIEQGRQPVKVGAHAQDNNETSIGVCLAGNFEIGKPTEQQMAAVKELCYWLCRKYGLDSRKKGVIVGHRDLNDTACPGKNLYKRLGEIRRFAYDRA
ncbi:peptidoglycan recognition family protein [Selenomonas sp. AB3002]|uniref:peptidoglycan recognition protein family protein n=1 Tax=Selenomonas sp. AB3002 TaxID=1392502 RepID=UPI0004966D2E